MRRKIEIKCPMCGEIIEKIVSEKVGVEAILCSNERCNRYFVVHWDVEPKIHTSKLNFKLMEIDK